MVRTLKHFEEQRPFSSHNRYYKIVNLEETYNKQIIKPVSRDVHDGDNVVQLKAPVQVRRPEQGGALLIHCPW